MIELTAISREFIYCRDGDAVVKIALKPDPMGMHSLMVAMEPAYSEQAMVHIDTALPRAQAVIAAARAKAGERGAA